MEKFKVFIAKFTPYLEDIRRRLYTTAVVFAVFFIAGFLSTGKILKYILSFFHIKDVVIATTSPFQFADLSIDIGLFLAFAVACPVLIYNVFVFLRPAMTGKEKGFFIFLVPLAAFLFLLGFMYGFLLMYYALIILAQVNVVVGIQNIWDVGMFLTQIVLTSTLLGVLFQFPIVLTLVIRSGLLDVSFLKEKRRVAIAIIFVFTALLPPTDGLSLIAMALPLIFLYEFTILVNSRFRKLQSLTNITNFN